MSILNELQVSLVPLLQTLQQQPVLGPLQFQLPHLGDGKRDSMEAGEAGPLGHLGKPSSPHSDTFPLQPAPTASCPAAPHLGLQVCQPRLALQQLSLELSSATLKLHLSSQQLLVFCARH